MNTTEMQATVTEINITDTGIYANAFCGNVSACVVIAADHVRVISQNAAHTHKPWRGAGRAFATVAEAIAAYKSQEMKAIIAAVDRRNA